MLTKMKQLIELISKSKTRNEMNKEGEKKYLKNLCR